ncbi:MAG: patatin-like phospholipase family protein [Endomicrobium sp.]|jgi:NTE family protein|nr:patatin-like phospholipase family protein [Endomicrobium sp.]
MKKFISALIIVSLLCTNAFSASPKDFDEDEFLINFYWEKISSLPSGKRPNTALVLGGGGARGFAHIGAFRVLKEEKIPIDLVVGTSMGSIAGAFYCADVSLDKIEGIAEKINWNKVSNFGVPSLINMVVAEKLLSNEKIEKFIFEVMGNLRFDQLKIPLVCVATDLNTGERVLLREGSVAFAVRASSTLPGIFKPVEYRQRYLIDGGLSENIPVNVAKLFDPEVIIAFAVPADITKNNTGSVFAVLMQSIYIQGRTLDEENLRMADVIVRPRVNEISAVDIKDAGKIMEKGFVAAKDAIKSIKTSVINKTREKYLLE